jgi:hypothetical protein
MITRMARAGVALLLVVVLVFPVAPAKACGPYLPTTIFIQRKHPDLPFGKFAAGNLGVLQPSYARSYLVTAYRYLNGGSFDAVEQRQLVALWAHRLDREAEWVKKRDAYYEWLEARYRYGGGEKPTLQNSDTGAPGYKFSPAQNNEFQNCADDAFLTAARTLEARAKQFGPHSAEIRSWREAQEAVFRNCGMGPPSRHGQPDLPPEAARELPALLQADRAYQMAAAYFYDGNWDEAERRFQNIAQDSASPWQSIAAIVVVRARLRRILLRDNAPQDDQEEKKQLAALDTELRDLEKLPSMRKLRTAIWRMRGFVEFRSDPEKRRLELANAIAGAKDQATLREDLDDFTKLLDRIVGEEPDPYDNESHPNAATASFEATAALRKQNDMIDWTLTFQATGAAAAEHAFAEWKEKQSLPWLVAALSKEDGKNPQTGELLEAAAAVPPSSPGHLMVAWQQARLQAESGHSEAAREIIAKVVAGGELDQLPSTANLFDALSMKLARSLDEFLQFAPRQHAVVTWDFDEFDLPDTAINCGDYPIGELQTACAARKSPPPLFDGDAAKVLTQGLPTPVLAEASGSAHLQTNLRLRVAASAWVRAVLLNDETVGRRVAPILSDLAPQLVPGLKNYLDAGPSSRRFAAAFLILHRPELRPYVGAGIGRQIPAGHIDGLRDNWWCSFAPEKSQENWGDYYAADTRIDGPLSDLYVGEKKYFPGFLSQAEQTAAQSEWATLTKLPAAPDWLATQVLDFAKANPGDPRVPEALYLVVRATRFGCGDTSTSDYSKRAFQLLHKQYPQSPWTAKTPYWY